MGFRKPRGASPRDRCKSAEEPPFHSVTSSASSARASSGAEGPCGGSSQPCAGDSAGALGCRRRRRCREGRSARTRRRTRCLRCARPSEEALRKPRRQAVSVRVRRGPSRRRRRIQIGVIGKIKTNNRYNHISDSIGSAASPIPMAAERTRRWLHAPRRIRSGAYSRTRGVRAPRLPYRSAGVCG